MRYSAMLHTSLGPAFPPACSSGPCPAPHQALAPCPRRLTAGPLNGYSRMPAGSCRRHPDGSSPSGPNRIGACMSPPSGAWHRVAVRLQSVLLAAALAVLGVPSLAGAAGRSVTTDRPSCKSVRLADIGWTDVSATTALFAALVGKLGYQPQITVLSVPVTFASMKNRDIDVFLGNWMPAEKTDRRPYDADGSIEVLGPNLTGAKYTLAVPAYAYAAGLRDFSDIHRFAEPLKHSIYGIEPGNDGNHLVLGMLKQNLFGLGDFKLIESSEQGMLAQVERAVHDHEPIVFLGWAPHPMNMRFDLRYLTGGDAVFGPNFGGAIIYTTTRAGYSAACPNLGRLLRNLKFSVEGESQLMDAILNQHLAPQSAAERWMQANVPVVDQWLQGVTTYDGRPGSSALRGMRNRIGAAGFDD